MKIRRWHYIILTLLLICFPFKIVGALQPPAAQAASACDTHHIYLNTPIYGSCSNDTSASACNTGDIPASVNLPGPVISAINGLKSMYVSVGQEKGVPWQMLAAVDHRESGNNPNASALDGSPIGAPNPDGQPTPHSKKESLEEASDVLKGNAQGVYNVTVSDHNSIDELKEIFLAYNRGNLYKNHNLSPDFSPYVMNGYDASHQNMSWHPPEDTVSGVDGDPLGALTVFAALAGINGGACSGSGDGSVVSIAQGEVGNKEDPDGSNHGPQINKYLGSAASVGEFWCADFVSWVYMTAGKPFTGGLDGGWRISAALDIANWMKNHGTWVDNGPNASDPQPGDIIYFTHSHGQATGGANDHIGIVEKVDGNTLDTIEGNYGNAVGRASYPNFRGVSEIVGWGRPN